jgi:hypothetical protein
MGLANSLDDCSSIQPQSEFLEVGNGEIDLTGIDDEEIDSYIMSEREAQYKDSLWMKINATFLQEQKGIHLSRTVMTTLHNRLINCFDRSHPVLFNPLAHTAACRRSEPSMSLLLV